tara:strand:+ start:81 stop:329 length:249 start_codon:yes stop_codon:yes gene_type:complete
MKKKSLKSGKFVYKSDAADMLMALVILLTIGGFFFLIFFDTQNKQNEQPIGPGRGTNVNDVFQSEQELENALEEYENENRPQ